MRLLDTGEASTNSIFLMRKFGYQVNPKTIGVVRIFAIITMFVIPAMILFMSSLSFIAMIIVVIANYIGTMAERWLFFAEARHVVNLFYGRKI